MEESLAVSSSAPMETPTAESAAYAAGRAEATRLESGSSIEAMRMSDRPAQAACDIRRTVARSKVMVAAIEAEAEEGSAVRVPR